MRSSIFRIGFALAAGAALLALAPWTGDAKDPNGPRYKLGVSLADSSARVSPTVATRTMRTLTGCGVLGALLGALWGALWGGLCGVSSAAVFSGAAVFSATLGGLADLGAGWRGSGRTAAAVFSLWPLTAPWR